jgi:phage baseplate assembly protein W
MAEQRMAGPAFPFGRTISSVLGSKTYVDYVNTAIRLALTTPKGSIVYNPELGSFVPFMIFDLQDAATLNRLYYYVTKDLERQVPLVRIVQVSIERSTTQIMIRLAWQFREDPNMEVQEAPVIFARG